MSRFLSPALSAVTPYTPGEQPQDQQYIKLNTNESPYLPSPRVVAAVSEAEVEKLRACGVEKFFNIGDSAKTGMIYEAISAAYDCAIALE